MGKYFAVKKISNRKFLIKSNYVIIATHNRRTKAIVIARPTKKKYFEMLIFFLNCSKNSFFIRQHLFYESLYFLIDHLCNISFEAIRLRKKLLSLSKNLIITQWH